MRTDKSFKENADHHIRHNIALDSFNIGCVTNFPIDYMHCVLLGITMQMLNSLVKKRKKEFSLKNHAIELINNNLKYLRKSMLTEFQRRQRTLKENDH